MNSAQCLPIPGLFTWTTWARKMNVALKRTKGTWLSLSSTSKARIANYSEPIIDADYLQTRSSLIPRYKWDFRSPETLSVLYVSRYLTSVVLTFGNSFLILIWKYFPSQADKQDQILGQHKRQPLELLRYFWLRLGNPTCSWLNLRWYLFIL